MLTKVAVIASEGVKVDPKVVQDYATYVGASDLVFPEGLLPDDVGKSIPLEKMAFIDNAIATQVFSLLNKADFLLAYWGGERDHVHNAIVKANSYYMPVKVIDAGGDVRREGGGDDQEE